MGGERERGEEKEREEWKKKGREQGGREAKKEPERREFLHGPLTV